MSGACKHVQERSWDSDFLGYEDGACPESGRYIVSADVCDAGKNFGGVDRSVFCVQEPGVIAAWLRRYGCSMPMLALVNVHHCG